MAKRARGTNVTIYLPPGIIREADALAARADESRSKVIAWALAQVWGLDDAGRPAKVAP